MRAVAQGNPSSVPRTLEPGRELGNLQEFAPPPALTSSKISPRRPLQDVPEGADALRFVWQGMRIEGSSVLSPEELLQYWGYEQGAEVTFADIYRFALKIGDAYAEAGYALSFAVVPEQEIAMDGGYVRLEVVEGYVEDIIYSGDVDAGIKSIAGILLQKRPLHISDLERALLLLNDRPGVRAQVMLSPGLERGGSVLNLEVSRTKRLNATAQVSNFLSEQLERDVVLGSLGFDSVSRSVGVSGGYSLGSNAYRSIGLQMTQHIGNDGLVFDLYSSYSWTRPRTDNLRALDYEGKSGSLSALLTYPLVRSRGSNLLLTTGLGLSSLEADLLSTEYFRDWSGSLQAGVVYEYAGFGRSVTTFDVGLIQGIDGFGFNANSRDNGELDSTVFELNAQRVQPLLVFGGGEFSLLGRFRGQKTFRGALFSDGECYYGGRRFGRVFDAGELSGDHCMLGSLELRWTGSVGSFLQTQLYGFIDGGVVWQEGVLGAGELRRQSAASAGLGLRAGLSDRVYGVLEINRQAKRITGEERDNNVRLVGSLSVQF